MLVCCAVLCCAAALATCLMISLYQECHRAPPMPESADGTDLGTLGQLPRGKEQGEWKASRNCARRKVPKFQKLVSSGHLLRTVEGGKRHTPSALLRKKLGGPSRVQSTESINFPLRLLRSARLRCRTTVMRSFAGGGEEHRSSDRHPSSGSRDALSFSTSSSAASTAVESFPWNAL